jgi:PKD repeat protein
MEDTMKKKLFFVILIIFLTTDIQAQSVIRFSKSEYTAYEADDYIHVNLEIQLEGDDTPVHINVGMTLCSAQSDYSVAVMPITWKSGDPNVKSLLFHIVDDKVFEETKSFKLILSNPSDNAILGEPAIAALTIIDDETDTYFYVSPSGDDSNNGSYDFPWQTLGKAAESTKAGDTVWIKAGIYNETFSPGNSGRIDAYITFQNMASETVVIDANGRDHGIILWNKSFIRMSGFEIINAKSDAVFIGHSSDSTAEKNIIEKMSIHDCLEGTGITVFGNNNHILFNTIYDCYYGIYVHGNHLNISNNDISNCTKSGIAPLGTSNAIQYNRIHHNTEYGISTWIGSSQILTDLTIQYNIIYDNTQQDIHLNGDGPGEKPDKIFIYNNTILNTCADSGICVYNECRNLTVKNNIISGVYDHGGLSLPNIDMVGFEEDYNIFYQTDVIFINNQTYTFSDYQQNFGHGGNSFFADPMLYSNYTLREESIAIDSGTIHGSEISGYTADIGAIEFPKSGSLPSANFIANTTQGASPLTVQFVCANHGITWQWDFDNDGILDATSRNPVHTYTETGSYTVSLTITTEHHHVCQSKTNYIQVTDGNDYYVSVAEGNDINPGTLAEPFKTIQKCAEIAARGDRCNIRQGIYREMITPANDQITFTAYNDEAVIISGAEIISNDAWSHYQDSIYKTPIQWSLNVRRSDEIQQISNNQLFVDGKMMVEARWPNIDVNHATNITNISGIREDNAKTDAATVITMQKAQYIDEDIASAGDFWVGGKINLAAGYNFIFTSGNITAQTNNSVTVEFNDDPGAWNHRSSFDNEFLAPQEANYYYLWGKLEALDYPGEWFIDPPDNYTGTDFVNADFSGTLYLQLPDNMSPSESNHLIELKKRNWAFDLRNRSHITINNISIVACGIVSNPASHDNTLSNIHGTYLSHFREIPPFYHNDGTQGIQLYGNNNVIRDSYFAYSAGTMLDLHSWQEENGNQQIVNNVMHDIGYEGSGVAIIAANLDGQHKNQIKNNTIFTSGLCMIDLGTGNDVTYNDTYQSHLQCTDIGTIYGWGCDGKGAIVAYNLVHDSNAEHNGSLNKYGTHGIYLDDDTYNYTIYRNITWNTSSPGIAMMGTNGTAFAGFDELSASNRKIFNNTVDGTLAAYLKDTYNGLPTHLIGTEFKNNFATMFFGFEHDELVLSNNFEGEGLFIDKNNSNYALKPYSPLIDQGCELSPYTQGFTDNAPDIGAIESSDIAFVAGALITEDDLDQLAVNCYRQIENIQCQIDNLPVGRKLPDSFELFIGDVKSNRCFTQMNYQSHLGTGICDILNPNLSEEQPLSIKLDNSSIPVEKGTFDIDAAALAIHSVTITNDTFSGGYSITIIGQNFDSSPDFLAVTQEIVITNTSGKSLYQYQIPLVINTQELITYNKMTSNCGDIRFFDQYGSLPYWLESGCNSLETLIWVKTSFIPENKSSIYFRYGNFSLSSQSNPQNTFYYFDSFEDGSIQSFYDLVEGDGISITETDGKFRISGTTNSANKYDTFGFSFMTWNNQAFRFPNQDYIIDTELTVISGTESFKGIFGSGNLFLFNEVYGDPLGKDIGYWNVDSWAIVGKSRIQTALLNSKKISLSCEKKETQTIIRFFEDYDFSQSLAERSLDNPSIGHFEYGPDTVADFDVTLDHIKIRSFGYPTPAISFGDKQYGVTVGNQVCENIQVLDAGNILCHVPDLVSGTVNIVVTNPDGEVCIFEFEN